MRLTTKEFVSVFRIRYGDRIGTGYITNITGKRVMVTAAHNIKGIAAGDNIFLDRKDHWQSIRVNECHVHPEEYDLAAISVGIEGSRTGISDWEGQTYPGQNVQFLGFPLGLKSSLDRKGYPLPLVRNAYFSGHVRTETGNLIVLDGFNNVGYSGAPVFVNCNGINTLLGTVSSYRYDRPTAVEKYSDPAKTKFEKTEYFVRANSGMINVIPVKMIFGLENISSS